MSQTVSQYFGKIQQSSSSTRDLVQCIAKQNGAAMSFARKLRLGVNSQQTHKTVKVHQVAAPI